MTSLLTRRRCFALIRKRQRLTLAALLKKSNRREDRFFELVGIFDLIGGDVSSRHRVDALAGGEGGIGFADGEPVGMGEVGIVAGEVGDFVDSSEEGVAKVASGFDVAGGSVHAVEVETDGRRQSIGIAPKSMERGSSVNGGVVS
jgi:hypothetical protein